MSILNRPSDGLLSVLIALRRALIAYGPQSEERLRDLCAPESEALGDVGMARRTLTRWKQLGLFQDDEEKRVSLAPVTRKIPPDDIDGLRSALLLMVLATENNPLAGAGADLDEDEDAKADKTLAVDFSLAAAWALAQDPYSFATSHPEVEALTSSQRVARKLFSNNTRWNGFVAWSAFLGLGYSTPRYSIVLNPAFAVRTVLRDVFATEPEMMASTFLARLADALPILDCGRYRQVIEADVRQPWRTFRENEVSPCLSAALQTLVAGGTLRLDFRSDAPSARTLLGRGGREGLIFSHVAWLGRK